jgi:hypothetical protein
VGRGGGAGKKMGGEKWGFEPEEGKKMGRQKNGDFDF